MHGGGAARIAYEKFGAVWGVGVGPTGRCYAIPTMHGGVDAIKPYVDQFVEYAKTHPMNRFLLTRIGCGIAGFKDAEIAPLFSAVMEIPNVAVPKAWLPYMVPNSVTPKFETPAVITDEILEQLSKDHLYAIGAGMSNFVPDVRIRYVCDTNEFGYTSLSNCFFFFGEGGMYIWDKEERWSDAHNQDMVEGMFGDECKGRGYAHRVISAGVATGFKDVVGEEIYTGDVIEIEQDHKRCRLAVCALNNGYGFKLGDTVLLLSECRGKKLKRVGTVFYQLDWSEYPVPVAERVMEFNNMNDDNEEHKQKMLMARFTPNFDKEPWKYEVLDTLGAQFHWNK
jgi:hypothetical protein